MAITRNLGQSILDYSERLKEKDPTIPEDSTLRAMSTILDQSFERSYNEVVEMMRTSPLIERGVADLHKKRTCGGFKFQNRSLPDLTPFEQMLCVSEYISQHPDKTRKTRTYAFALGEKVVPVWLKHPQNGEASLWTTLLGTTQGALKAPKYTEMTEYGFSPPDIFLDPLTTLEMHRNPSHIGALAMKSAAFDAGQIDNTHRYQGNTSTNEAYKTASAELRKQKSPFTRKMVAQAAGFNLALINETNILQEDENNLLPELKFEDLTGEGYNDDAHPFASSLNVVKTFEDALRGNLAPLDNQTRKFFAARLGNSQIPEVNAYVVETLFGERNQE